MNAPISRPQFAQGGVIRPSEGEATRETAQGKSGALALSVQQPWAAAILWAGKDVENRTWSTRHRGRIGIHAGKAYDSSADEVVAGRAPGLPSHLYEVRGLLGTVEIVGCHQEAPGCCDSQWAADGQWHWELSNPRPFAEPIPCNGRLGLWPVPDRVLMAARGR